MGTWVDAPFPSIRTAIGLLNRPAVGAGLYLPLAARDRRLRYEDQLMSNPENEPKVRDAIKGAPSGYFVVVPQAARR